MVKIAPITNITAGYMSAAKINDAFDKVETAFANTLSRDGSSPNTMSADLDLNDNDILNVNSLQATTITVGGLSVLPYTNDAAEVTVNTVVDLKALTTVAAGAKVRTLGYYSAYDGGGAEYLITTVALHGTPDGYGSHLMTSGLVAAIMFTSNTVRAETFGVLVNTECSARWQEAFWQAEELQVLTDQQSYFSCKTSFLTKNTLWMTNRAKTGGEWMVVDQTGSIKATTGGELAASVFASSVPIMRIGISKSVVQLRSIDCNKICSGILVNDASATRVWFPNIVRFQRFGYFVANGLVGSSAEGSNGNHILFYPNIKQWEQSDAEFNDPLDTQWTGDCLVAGYKDWQAIGGTYGWSRTAVLMLDQTTGSGDVEGRTVYNGWKSQGCGDFFLRGAHIMQGRPDGPARIDNRELGGPIVIECWNQSNKAYILDTDWDSGTGQFYGHRVVIEGCSMIAGGQNRIDDRVVIFDPVCRFYARADATNPAGLELGQNNNLTVGFYPFEGQVWTGNYDTINYDNRQKSPGNTGPVTYQGIWNAETAVAFPTVATLDAFWLVRTETSGSTVTFDGQSFTDGDLLFPIVNPPSTTTYTGNWWVSGNNQVEMLLRGVQGRANAGERYFQATTAGVPFQAYYAPGNSLTEQFWIADSKAQHDWDGTDWNFDATNISMKNWKFEGSGNHFIPTGGASQYIGDSTHIVTRVYSSRYYYTETIFDDVGTGTPEGVITAGIGSTYRRLNGGAGTSFYVKESGTGNTGWVGK